ncbi:hypothetical protein ES692_15535 [Psychroserpens burtonensis]|uniref:Uncharacterized protein n=1 Tax=Psychroserpens burtonensis TaxID=49278 RepID=A0A5C7B796_9FLAO|nr:hypothetical protein [Psychroserpens burtonensis]TXE15691.1 hypothetical protein ES692_15535 [Psychroserpens burtonensis]
MPHILKNKNLEIHIDGPLENYKGSRFDWTGKIVSVKFQNMQLAGLESPTNDNEHYLGKGFYNEFGIDDALGFEETPIGGWFHKIGVGLLKKEDNKYHISKTYAVKPAEFKITSEANTLLIQCTSEIINGFGYILKKDIELKDAGFTIRYRLENTGEKDIITDEYVHNFTAFNKEGTGSNYTLKFPFQLQPALFEETVNPEGKVAIGQNDITFKSALKQEFFFSNLSGDDSVDAQWELEDLDCKIGISETGNFKTNKVNVWGAPHVLCPELFFKIALKFGEATEWSRQYKVYNLS